MKRKEEREEQVETPQEKYKRAKKSAIVLIVLGLIYGVGYTVLMRFLNKGAPVNFYMQYGPLAIGAVLFLIGIIYLSVAKKKYKKALATPQPQGNSMASSHPGERLREMGGMNLLELFEIGESVETLNLAGSEGVYTFDLLWGNAYNGVGYLVVGRREDEAYMKYILRIDNEEPSVVDFEEGDEIRAVIIADFTKAVGNYAQENGYSAQAVTETINTEPKGKKKKTFAALFIIYLVILGAGLIGYFKTFFMSLSGDALIICKAVSLAYVLITPSFLVYFGGHNPFGMKKGGAVFFIILGTLGLVACLIVGMPMITELGEVQGAFWGFVVNTFLPIALIIATIAYVAVFAFWCRGMTSGWYLGMGIAVTLLFPVATALVLAFFILSMILAMIRWLLTSIGILAADTSFGRGFISGWTGKRSASTGYQIIDESGYTRTLTPYEGNRYRDDTGAFWKSDDNGNTFYRD